MKYIVWRSPYTSYGYPQGDGYFVKYKNKCADEFSTNWFEANRYKSIGPAINRLGLEINKQMFSIEDFFKANKLLIDYTRNKSINEILDYQDSVILTFERGYIAKIDDNNNPIGNAGDELLDFIKVQIESNKKHKSAIDKKLQNLGLSNYINNSISDEEFYK